MFMADYNFIDKQGLTKFWQKSKEYIDNEDSNIINALESEARDRESADLDLQNKINIETSNREESIRSEAFTRESEDSRIESLISDEKESRESADEALRESLESESAEREAEDLRIESLISDEKESRESADEELREDILSLNSGLNNLSSEVSSLSDDLTSLDDKVSEINSSYIKDIKLDGVSLVDNQEANISSSAIFESIEDPIDIKINSAVEEEVEKLKSDFISKEEIGKENGVASLGEDGKVPAEQLPEIESSSVIKVDTFEDLPEIGESGKLYITLDDNFFYKWDLSQESYTDIGSGGGSEEEIQLIKQALINHQSHIDGLESSVSTISADVAQNTADIVDAKSSIQGVQESVVEVSGNLESLETSFENLETSVNEALADKVSYEDIIDNLISSDIDKPLSANQGSVLKSNINSLSSRVDSLQMTFKFKGTVSSYEELPASGNIEGDVYQIVSDDDDNGETYAWNGSSWIQISAAAIDISSMMSTVEDVNEIINKYK